MKVADLVPLSTKNRELGYTRFHFLYNYLQLLCQIIMKCYDSVRSDTMCGEKRDGTIKNTGYLMNQSNTIQCSVALKRV